MSPKRKEYFVNGIIQIRVMAYSAKHAVVTAQLRAVNLERSPSLVIELDNIDTAGHASVGLDDAGVLDE